MQRISKKRRLTDEGRNALKMRATAACMEIERVILECTADLDTFIVEAELDAIRARLARMIEGTR